MAPSALLEHVRECAGQVAIHGTASRYSLDCLVRHLQATGWPGALALGHDTSQPLTITAGIGTLTLTPTTIEFTPARTPKPQADQPKPLPAPPDLVAARLDVCRACSSWSVDRCTIAGCGCTGLGQTQNLFSRCPTGNWPPPH